MRYEFCERLIHIGKDLLEIVGPRALLVRSGNEAIELYRKKPRQD